MLIDDKGAARLADFGLSRTLEAAGFPDHSGGMARWAAIEILSPSGANFGEEALGLSDISLVSPDPHDQVFFVTKATDIWALGMTVLEVSLTGHLYLHTRN